MVMTLTLLLALTLVLLRSAWSTIALACAAVLLGATLLIDDTPLLGWVLWAFLVAVIGIKPVRQRILSRPLFRFAKAQLPELSAQERDAIAAGAIGLEADLMRGQPQWDRYMSMKAALTPERAGIPGWARQYGLRNGR